MILTFDFGEPSDEDVEAIGSLWGTVYFVKHVKPAANGVPLVDLTGNALGPKLSRKDWCLAGIEGTLALKAADGSTVVYNYAGKKGASQTDCSGFSSLSPDKVAALERTRWRRAKGPYGDGAGSRVLVPYRTIAVDREVIKLGTAIYVPDARGIKIKLPGGNSAVHDGYFLAGDVGGAIKGRHIDFFIGTTEKNPFPFATASSKVRFKALRVKRQEIVNELAKLHKA